MYDIRVPEFGWERENLAPWRSGETSPLGAPRVTAREEIEPGKRLCVALVRIDGVEEIERAWVEELVADEGARYWLESEVLAEGDIHLLRDLTAPEAAEQLGVGDSTMTLWCRQGRLPGAYQQETPRGNVWRIPESALDDFERPKRGKPAKSERAVADCEE